MFRFSIRELMLVTLVVAIGVAWFLDHRRLHGALVNSNTAIEAAIGEAKNAKEQQELLNQQVKEELAQYGFQFKLRCVGNKMVRRLVPFKDVP